MTIVERTDGRWIIMHAGCEIAEDFASENDAWAWADHHIDDQVLDGPNCFSEPLVYRTAPPTGAIQ